MSKKLNINTDYDAIRFAFNEAKVLLNKGQITMFEYRSLCHDLLNEVREMDEKINNENIKEILNAIINKEKDTTTKS